MFNFMTSHSEMPSTYAANAILPPIFSILTTRESNEIASKNSATKFSGPPLRKPQTSMSNTGTTWKKSYRASHSVIFGNVNCTLMEPALSYAILSVEYLPKENSNFTIVRFAIDLSYSNLIILGTCTLIPPTSNVGCSKCSSTATLKRLLQSLWYSAEPETSPRIGRFVNDASPVTTMSPTTLHVGDTFPVALTTMCVF